MDAGGVEVTALVVLFPEEAGGLVAVSAGGHGESFLGFNFGHKSSSA
jgi:hypothetical protein